MPLSNGRKVLCDKCVTRWLNPRAGQLGRSQQQRRYSKPSQRYRSTGCGRWHGAYSHASIESHSCTNTQANTQADAEQPTWKRRWTIVALCFVAFMLCNMDRVNMSIAILPMAQDYGWSSVTVGLVQSSFFWCACYNMLQHCLIAVYPFLPDACNAHNNTGGIC